MFYCKALRALDKRYINPTLLLLLLKTLPFSIYPIFTAKAAEGVSLPWPGPTEVITDTFD